MTRRNQTLQQPFHPSTSRIGISQTQKRNQKTTLRQLDRNHTKRMRSLQIRRLANNLREALQIPTGDHLIFALGEGTEQSNLEALTTWITQHCAPVEYLHIKDQFTKLKHSLMVHLMDNADSNNYG